MVRFNEELTKKICQKIATGVPINHSCASVGISRSQFYEWYRRGKQAKRGKYHDFYEKVEKAKADAISLRVARINKAGENGNWQADAWYLERIDPEHFGKKDKVQVDAKTKIENKSFDNLIQAFEESKKEWLRNKEEERDSSS